VLHTEPTGGALLASRSTGKWHLSGILDFADAMTGPAEYDFVAVPSFVTRGDPGLFRRFLTSYGYGSEQLHPGLQARLMQMTLVHRFCHLRWYLSMSPVAETSPTLEQLARTWFAF
jgi:hygromycin-B 7''-O-kinase